MMRLQLSSKRNIIRFMEISLFVLSKVGRGEDMGIPKKGIRFPHVKKAGSINQDQMQKFLLGRGIIRRVLPTPRKARTDSSYGLAMRKHFQGEKPREGRILLRWRGAYA